MTNDVRESAEWKAAHAELLRERGTDETPTERFLTSVKAAVRLFEIETAGEAETD